MKRFTSDDPVELVYGFGANDGYKKGYMSGLRHMGFFIFVSLVVVRLLWN